MHSLRMQRRYVTPARLNILSLAKTLWLFTFSDLKTIVVPSTVFGLSNGLVADSYGIVGHAPILRERLHTYLLARTPVVLFWVWINYIPFAINNQSSPTAIAEDSINKPWRPLPSGRISRPTALLLMFFFYLCAIAFSLRTGGARQCLGLVALGIWYNNLHGADTHPLIRNLINGAGYVCFTSGAMEIAVGTTLSFQASPRLAHWFMMIAAIITTTVHGMDMYDQEGDAVRGRRTVPLVIGDMAARWTIAVPMLAWGWICPLYWHASRTIMALSVTLSLVIAVRTLGLRTVRDDRITFVLWNMWMSLVYVLPLAAVG